MDQTNHKATLGNGRYTIQRRLGAGGEGAVFLAYDGLLKRWVAIKRIHNQSEHGTSAIGTSAIREATHLASLQHPNILTVHDIVTSDDGMLVVMEYLPGQNVDELGEPMDAAFFTEFAAQCLRGLAAAHAIGMVHRDIKPGNIMIAGQHSGGFQVKILDFGLAKVIDEPTLQTMDHSGALTGSIFMMSPEQLEGLPIDHRTDLYSLGCVFYKALTRRYPFGGKSVPAVVTAHLTHNHAPLESLRPDLPQPLVRWVERLFARDRNHRPPTAKAALEALPKTNTPGQHPPPDRKPSLTIHSISPPKPRARFSKKAVLPAIVVAVLALAGGAYWRLEGLTGRNHHAKMIASADGETSAHTSFVWNERKAILAREGKKATITGTIGGFEEDNQDRFHLVFKGANSRDPTLCFNRAKGDFSALLLEKNVGLDIQATGIVGTDGTRVFLENPTLREIVIPKTSPSPRE